MIKIMVDSASDCRNQQELYDIFVPITVDIDERAYQDGIDLDNDSFYELLPTAQAFPKTSQPSPDDYLRIFKDAKKSGDEILYFALSSGLSGTYQGACIAKQMAEYDGIYIIDSLAASHMIGILAQHARKLIAEGQTASQIAAACEELKHRVTLFAALDTLEYLYKGGRLNRASAAVGSLAGIKPIITITQEGSVSNCGKAIGMNRAIQMLTSKLDELVLDDHFPVYSLYTCGTENVEKLELKLSAAGHPAAQRLQVGPTVGAHIGPGACGVLFVTK